MEWFSHINTCIKNIEFTGFEEKIYGNTKYYGGNSISLGVEYDVLKFIVFFPGYEGKMPYGVSWLENNSSIVQRFGEPDKKISSKELGIEITYDFLGISVEFVNPDWNDLDNRIKSVILFKGNVENPFKYNAGSKLCSNCYEVANKICGGCKLFNYCCVDCQRLHWRKHKIQCFYIKNANNL